MYYFGSRDSRPDTVFQQLATTLGIMVLSHRIAGDPRRRLRGEAAGHHAAGCCASGTIDLQAEMAARRGHPGSSRAADRRPHRVSQK
jgi:hypothetical protein